MSTWKHSPRTRGFHPETDALEDRQLLSAVVSGMDSKGDAWTLRLMGPGQISVVKQPDSSGSPGSLDSATDINTITIAGTNPLTSKLVGVVTKVGAGSDGRVFFQTMTQLHGVSEQQSSTGYGILAINMPNFWLANTTTQATAATTTPTVPEIKIPDGVDTFRFGGVDTTANQLPATSTTTSDTTNVILGLPSYGGSRIIIDKAVSSTQFFTTPASGTTPASTATLQHGVDFVVSGRLSLFQANSIVGDAADPPGQFLPSGSTQTAQTGGTTIFDGTAGTQPFFPDATFQGSVSGQIGNLRVGGNATNFTTIVNDATGSGSARISNFSIGGQTDNVMLIAPNGSRNLSFGEGMDTVQIASHVINSLRANGGAINSTVQVDRSAGRVQFGGDVVNSTILSGYVQNYGTITSDVIGSTNSFGQTTPPTAIPTPVSAQPDGGMSVLVAGSVQNSVFAASTEPFNNVFGSPNELFLTAGHIKAKVEGTIDNSTATPSSPNQAFYAKHTTLLSGPVVPPNVPTEPYARTPPTLTPGIKSLDAPIVGVSTPKGPAS